MRTQSVHTEQQLLITALENQDRRVRNLILAETRVNDFGTEIGKEIRQRFDTLRQRNKPLGRAEDFGEDPGLSKEAKDFIRGTPGKRRKTAVYTQEQVEALINTLKQYRKARILLDGLRETSQVGDGNLTEDRLNTACNTLEETLRAIRDDNAKESQRIGRGTTKQEAIATIKRLTTPDARQFITSGLPGLDANIFGISRGDLFVMSAQRGGGKTAVMLQMAINQYRAGLNVGIISLEMTQEQITQRILSNVTSTPIQVIRTKQNIKPDLRRKMFRDYAEFLKIGRERNCVLMPWDIKDPHYTPYEIELDLGPFGYDCIFIDYLTLFHTGKKDLWVAQKEYSRYLKTLAKRLDCAIVLLTQLNEEDRVKYGKGPEEDADWWLWWRWGDAEKETGAVELKMAKARHGRECIVPAQFKLEVMQIDTGAVGTTGMSRYGSKQDTWEAGDV